LGLSFRLARCISEPEATGQNLHATCLVDEVERAAVEGEFLICHVSVAR
jgi:hypothetical protein